MHSDMVSKRNIKLLILTSALDLRLPYGCTSAWWYLFKALYESNVDLLVTVYQGRVVPSPWWGSYENPCYWEGYIFAALKTMRSSSNRMLPFSSKRFNEQNRENWRNKITLKMARTLIRPRWNSYLFKILRQSPDVDAVLFVNVPINHLSGIPRLIRDNFHIPVIYYDPDMPVSLPKFQGFATGFRIYEDADLQEYDMFIGNSKGGCVELENMGVHNVHFLPWAVDTDVIRPVLVSEQDIDVFFYGFGNEYRSEWMKAMLVDPSYTWPERTISIRGSGFKMDLGNVGQIKNVPFSRLRELCCRGKINLNIGRQAHATVYASSSMRPYELAALECCIVSNPYLGIEEWFEPGQEIFVLSEPEEINELYPWLWLHEDQRRQIGKRARERVMKEHTYQHRAKQLIQMIRDII